MTSNYFLLYTCLNCRYNKLDPSFILVWLAVCEARISWFLEVKWHQWSAVPWNENWKNRIIWKNPTQNLLPLYLVEQAESLSFPFWMTTDWAMIEAVSLSFRVWFSWSSLPQKQCCKVRKSCKSQIQSYWGLFVWEVLVMNGFFTWVMFCKNIRQKIFHWKKQN